MGESMDPGTAKTFLESLKPQSAVTNDPLPSAASVTRTPSLRAAIILFLARKVPLFGLRDTGYSETISPFDLIIFLYKE